MYAELLNSPDVGSRAVSIEKSMDSISRGGDSQVEIDCLKQTPELNEQMDIKLNNIQQDFSQKIFGLSKLINKQKYLVTEVKNRQDLMQVESIKSHINNLYELVKQKNLECEATN